MKLSEIPDPVKRAILAVTDDDFDLEELQTFPLEELQFVNAVAVGWPRVMATLCNDNATRTTFFEDNPFHGTSSSRARCCPRSAARAAWTAGPSAASASAGTRLTYAWTGSRTRRRS